MIVGLDKPDDAGVYKLSDELAIVQTVDFITAIVDDPYSFGMITAANSLSDVYAMGGRPVTAMNIVAFPSETMDISVLTQVLSGALAKLNEAGVTLVGGHSVKNNELKYGLCVTGIVHPQKVVTKSEAKVGDKLILTKPLGTGIMTTALKAGLVDEKTKTKLTEQMAKLNDKAAEVMVSLGAHACTDITGFGLIGHACEMAENSGVTIELYLDKVPFIRGVLQFAQMGLIPEGMYANEEFRAHMVEGSQADEDLMAILYAPQTSGGLFIAVSPEKADKMVEQIRQAGDEQAAIVGQVIDSPKSQIIVR
ncbi:Selenide, water dikinase [subsurface metagenome]